MLAVAAINHSTILFAENTCVYRSLFTRYNMHVHVLRFSEIRILTFKFFKYNSCCAVSFSFLKRTIIYLPVPDELERHINQYWSCSVVGWSGRLPWHYCITTSGCGLLRSLYKLLLIGTRQKTTTLITVKNCKVNAAGLFSILIWQPTCSLQSNSIWEGNYFIFTWSFQEY